jgi:RHS repeat-associated protein
MLWVDPVSISYDAENELAGVWVSNAWSNSFAYDGIMRRRIERDYSWDAGTSGWQETNEVHFIYDGNAVIEERNASNIPLVSYTLGIGGLLARTTYGQELPGAPATAFYHADGNGNITALMYPNQQLAAKYLYDPFGNMLAMSGPLASFNKYRFSSQEWNDNAGLYYFGRRFYDPILQRWINRDPIQESGGLNLYGFVANDPINTIDYLGFCDPSLWDLFWGNVYNNWPQNLQQLGNGLELGVQALENAAASFVNNPGAFSSNFDGNAGNQIADAVAWILGGENNVSAALSSLETSQGIGQALVGAETGLAGGALLGAATPKAVASAFATEDIAAGSELAEDAGLGSRVAGGLAGASAEAGLAAAADASSAAAGEAGSAAAEGAGAVQAGEVTTYQDFVDRSVVGDNLEGHEIWQHANLNENGLATTRLSTPASQMNPVIALDRDTHMAVNAAQRALDARAMTPVQNINANAQILRDLNAVSPEAINAAEQAALRHAAENGF